MGFDSAKPVIMTDANGQETEYPSQAKAKIASGLSQTSISNMCNGFGPKTVKGWSARFKGAGVAALIPTTRLDPPEAGV